MYLEGLSELQEFICKLAYTCNLQQLNLPASFLLTFLIYGASIYNSSGSLASLLLDTDVPGKPVLPYLIRSENNQH